MESMVESKNRNSVLKLEEFFSNRLKDEVFAVLDKFPEEKSVIVDYNDLEIFDPDSADLLIEKPEETLEAASKSIVNIDPQRKNAQLNVRFKNVRNNVPLRYLRSEFIGKFIAVDGIVRKTDEIHPRIMTAVFECRSCMRIHEVAQKSNIIHEPAVCTECGGRSFKLLQDESQYMDTQTVKLQEPLENLSGGDQPRQINIVLEVTHTFDPALECVVNLMLFCIALCDGVGVVVINVAVLGTVYLGIDFNIVIDNFTTTLVNNIHVFQRPGIEIVYTKLLLTGSIFISDIIQFVF
jgi:DNA replicative helicase MCM subunit Mcm2 (Cdc46/Mcm family)